MMRNVIQSFYLYINKHNEKRYISLFLLIFRANRLDQLPLNTEVQRPIKRASTAGNRNGSESTVALKTIINVNTVVILYRRG